MEYPPHLFKTLSHRLTLSDSLKNHLTSISPAEHLVQAQMLTDPPRSAAEREFYGQLLWRDIRGRFEQTLSASDLRLWACHPADVGSSPAHLGLLKSFDDFNRTDRNISSCRARS